MLSGTIRDATGGVLPGATVAITSVATGAVREGVADGIGIYRAAALAPGTYDVRIALDGFTTKVFPAVVLTVGQQAELDAQLEIAPTSTTVVVQGGARLVETTRVAQSSTLSQLEIEGLPIVTYSARAPGMTPEELSWFVDDTVVRALQGVKAVSQIERLGGVEREIRVSLDPDRLLAFGITAGDVNRQLRATNVDLAGGRGEIGGREQAIRSLQGAGLEVTAITDVTPIPHNGCRPPKRRRV